MRCQIVHHHLQDLLEDRLPSPMADNIHHHLSFCAACAAEYDSWRRFWSDLDGFAPSRITPDLTEGVLFAIGQEPTLPRGLLCLFVAGALGTLGSLFTWVDRLGAGRSLFSAFFWILAGVASVFSIWFAVVRSYRLEAVVPVREE